MEYYENEMVFIISAGKFLWVCVNLLSENLKLWSLWGLR